MVKIRKVAAIVATGALMTLLAACSDGESEDPTGTDQVTAGPDDTDPTVVPDDGDATSEPTESPGDVDETTAEPEPEPDRDPLVELENNEGARADLSNFQCAATDGVWAASGTVTNEADNDLVYVVSVAVVEQEGRSSVVRRNIVLDVAAGEAVDFEEAELVVTARDDLECFVGVNRGSSVLED